MVAYMPVGNSEDLLASLAWMDTLWLSAGPTRMISQMIEIATCADPACTAKLPMRFTYYIDGPSEPIIRITREADVCLHCATKMFLAAGDLVHALNG